MTKKIYLLALMSVAVLTTGCAQLGAPNIAENSKIKVYVDESATDIRAAAFIEEYVKVINSGIDTKYAYTYSDCNATEIKEIKLQDFKKFLVTYSDGAIITCQKNTWLAKDKAFRFDLKAKKISNNKIEIETDGTLGDIMSKQIAIHSIQTTSALANLLPYGYSNFNIDGKALLENRLVLDLFPEYTKIKDVFVEDLKKRGYIIVENYKDANRAIFIENMAALPLRYAGQVNNYQLESKEQIFADSVRGVKGFAKQSEVANAGAHLSQQSLRDLGSISAVYGAGFTQYAGLMIGANIAGMVLDSMFGPSEKDLFQLRYKIIIENKDVDLESYDAVEKYRFRAALLQHKLITSSSTVRLKEMLLFNGSENDIRSDIMKYFEKDGQRSENSCSKANYEKLNSKEVADTTEKQ